MPYALAASVITSSSAVLSGMATASGTRSAPIQYQRSVYDSST